MREAVETITAAVEAGARICVHGDYDADGICATALAVLLLRELGADVAWHLPSRFEEGYGLNAGTLTRLAEEGLRARPDRRLRHHRRRRGRARALARPRGRRHRPPPAGRVVPGVPGRRAAEGRLSVQGALRHRRRLEARAGAARARPSVPRAAPRRRRARDGRRRRAARRREPRARAARAAPASRRRRSPGCAR